MRGNPQAVSARLLCSCSRTAMALVVARRSQGSASPPSGVRSSSPIERTLDDRAAREAEESARPGDPDGTWPRRRTWDAGGSSVAVAAPGLAWSRRAGSGTSGRPREYERATSASGFAGAVTGLTARAAVTWPTAGAVTRLTRDVAHLSGDVPGRVHPVGHRRGAAGTQRDRGGRRRVTGRPHALDIGCGTGTQAVYLARLGWRVTAIDAVDRPR